MNATVEFKTGDLNKAVKHNAFPSHLTPQQIEAFGKEVDALREKIMATIGEKDAQYIRRMIKTQRWLELGGRGLLFAGIFPPAWLAGTAMLGVAKILENMEIGHNVMHGQWDWMRDPDIHSTSWEWDTASPAKHWKHSHNHMHHKWTNVVGKDRDVGYGILRMSEKQAWSPYYLGQPVYNFLLATFFQWGVALHEIETEKLRSGEKNWKETWPLLKEIGAKSRKQVLKDYVLFPALAGPFFLPVLAGNVVANLMRNYWAYAIIFCGHFPEGTEDFTEEQVENETKGQWYLRQMMGSANIEGGKLMHIMSGNLSHQIEHHLFPDMPSNRYAEAAAEMKKIAAKYNVQYNTNSFRHQITSSLKKVMRLSLPNKKQAGTALA